MRAPLCVIMQTMHIAQPIKLEKIVGIVKPSYFFNQLTDKKK